jgi:hypothetical protein
MARIRFRLQKGRNRARISLEDGRNWQAFDAQTGGELASCARDLADDDLAMRRVALEAELKQIELEMSERDFNYRRWLSDYAKTSVERIKNEIP